MSFYMSCDLVWVRGLATFDIVGVFWNDERQEIWSRVKPYDMYMGRLLTKTWKFRG